MEMSVTMIFVASFIAFSNIILWRGAELGNIHFNKLNLAQKSFRIVLVILLIAITLSLCYIILNNIFNNINKDCANSSSKICQVLTNN